MFAISILETIAEVVVDRFAWRALIVMGVGEVVEELMCSMDSIPTRRLHICSMMAWYFVRFIVTLDMNRTRMKSAMAKCFIVLLVMRQTRAVSSRDEERPHASGTWVSSPSSIFSAVWQYGEQAPAGCAPRAMMARPSATRIGVQM